MFQLRLRVDTREKAVEEACTSVFQSAIRQKRYRLKKKYFTGIPIDHIRRTSPVSYTTDEMWNKLVEKWMNPKNLVCYLSAIL